MEFPQVDFDEGTAPNEALCVAVAWLDEKARTDDELAAAALTIFEPLIDWFWKPLGPQLIALASERADFRRAVSGCMLDPGVDDDFAEQLYATAAKRT